VSFDQVRRDTELKKPDRLDVRRKERPRRAKCVIDVRVARIVIAVGVEDVERESLGFRVVRHDPQRRRVDRTLG
jgi:hypothetical protein